LKFATPNLKLETRFDSAFGIKIPKYLNLVKLCSLKQANSFLAHEYGKMYWYHCCGNVSKVIEDLIEDVKIDTFHSFHDMIIPVGKFMKRYGERIAALGGIDMDKLGRMNEQELRKYVRDTLDECMPGRYALGSGNTVANYIPPQNYLAMLDEGSKWAFRRQLSSLPKLK